AGIWWRRRRGKWCGGSWRGCEPKSETLQAYELPLGFHGMAYVPKDAEWFLAQLVEEFRVAGHRRNVVHINYVLIKARTPPEAYRKAMQLGKRANSRWRNPKGELVTHRFLGLRDLDVIHDPLEHGCEIMFFERLGMT